jgi:hypothetical protein
MAMQKFSGLSDLLLQGIEAGVVACLQVSTQRSIAVHAFAVNDVWCRKAYAEEHDAGRAAITEAGSQHCSCMHALA